MTPYNLVIIDMQPSFPACQHKPTIKTIREEIREAKRVGAAIIVVEMKSAGTTIPEVMNLVGDYEKSVLVEKLDTSGASEILEVIRRNDFLHMNRFRVTGVYTDVCVADTVNKLAQFDDLEIEVLAEGCYSGAPAYPNRHTMYTDGKYDYFKAIRPNDNVSLVY
jgi:nicotinamidase-related amidase